MKTRRGDRLAISKFSTGSNLISVNRNKGAQAQLPGVQSGTWPKKVASVVSLKKYSALTLSKKVCAISFVV